MSQKQKLLAAIKANPRGVRFDDACKVALWLNFDSAAASGSHHAFSRTGEPVGLNFQNRGGLIKPYQARQLIEMIDKYGEEV